MFQSLLPCERALIGFLLRHLASGSAGGVVVGIGILVLDIASLRTLMSTSESWLTATLMLFGGLIVTFGSAAIAIGVMTLSGEEGNDGDGP